ncbi:DEAD/DEAH box helicase [Malikia spinosa]|uniref:DEAD/DEAH box helicase n=1 Tax=Malikia spinosa TaxID=86180 RepID=A0A7C9NX39_9BURK|nr:DEAD/DEAH box helicase [Malikia spinosa]MYZ52924.1 DEAD/DEAH box helicase [Malikia spinosa]
MSFASLGLSPALLHATRELGFSTPTPVQAEAIPAILRGADVQAQAQTGSGKTAAYALPMLHGLASLPMGGYRRQLRALILVPTRELALQVGELLQDLAARQAGSARQVLKVQALYGGVSINPQLLALRGGADLVVATPGRLLDVIEHNGLQLDQVRQLVLDEADRLLDLGFAEELDRVLKQLPVKRQNLLFSATFPAAVQGLADALLREPVQIRIEAEVQAPLTIAQQAIAVDADKRTTLLRHLAKEKGWKQALVFVASQYAAEHVANKLYKNGIYATAFHGGLSQGGRRQVLDEFKSGRWDILVTTDLAARGLDIEGLPVVVNYDLPRSAVDYLHRIGRTGRAGAEGLAVSFVSADQFAHWQLIQKRQALQLELETVAGFEPSGFDQATEVPAEPVRPGKLPPGTGGIKGKRPSKKDKLRAAAAAASTQGDTRN